MTPNDAARNRGLTAALVVLIMLAVTLGTASVGTLVRLVGASGDLMSRADAPQVVQLHVGAFDQDEVDRWVAQRPDAAHHQTMLLPGIDGANLRFDGEPQTAIIQQNSLVVPNAERDLLLDLDDRPIAEVEPGTIVLPVYDASQGGLDVGDTVTIAAPDGFVTELTIAAFARDSIMNPAVANSKRLAVAASDLDEVRAHRRARAAAGVLVARSCHAVGRLPEGLRGRRPAAGRADGRRRDLPRAHDDR